MGALNAPTRPGEKQIPEQAKGNPVYEQTRQDMPLWCCGRNCGRNSRITVFILGILGICASSIVCLSPHYFYFHSLRNDTFTEKEKYQPKPFRYATEANVGLFRYQILEVYEFPWPPTDQERMLADAMHNRELERLATLDSGSEQVSSSTSSSIFDRVLQNKFPVAFYDDDDDFSATEDEDELSNSTVPPTLQQSDTMDIYLTLAPAASPADEGDDILNTPVGTGMNNGTASLPTEMPSFAPTGANPNDLIDVEIGVVKPYPPGSEFDKLFKNGQSGAMWAPILASIGLIFATIEFCCCIYKCSWLPTAIFLYTAFMLQLMTMFLFMTEDFCDYTQDCILGSAGYMSVIAVVCYFVCQMLVCMTPRPPPKYNLLKKPPVRRKKKKKKRPNEFEEDEKDHLAGSQDRFNDESSFSNSGYVDPYDDQDPYSSQYGDVSNSYSDNDYNSGYGDGYNDGYGQDGYGQDGYGQDGYGQDDYNNGYNDYNGSYDNADQRSYDQNSQGYDDYGDTSQRSYDQNSQGYDDYGDTSQRSYDNDAYNEGNEEAPSSSSSRRRKKK